MAGASPHFLLWFCRRRAVYYYYTNPSRLQGGGSGGRAQDATMAADEGDEVYEHKYILYNMI